MTLSSSARAATVVSWSAAVVMQPACAVASSCLPLASSSSVFARSPSAVALPSWAAASADFSSSKSLESAATWSSRDCFSRLKLCAAWDSALRSWPSCSSAFSFRSSRTSRMLPLRVLYAAAAGAPALASSSSSLELLRCDCKSAESRCLSALEKATASTTELRPLRRLSKLEVSTCAKAAGCLDISRSRMLTARASLPMTSMSSASLALKSAASCSRMAVAAFRSLSSVAMLAPSSPILVVHTMASSVPLAIAASSLAFMDSAVFILKPAFVEASSHHSTNSA
mmetsp:Transcript_16083/g.42487  ORF Transcript_16083/g.42487 Transcript_16083/m.42487 type:complete len:284 (-) Transcript_16083:218-1069(-)